MGVDVNGFKIEISADIVSKITSVDDAIERIQKNATGAAQGINGINKALAGIDASQIQAVAKAVQQLAGTQVGQGFKDMETTTKNMLTNITEVVNKLAQVSKGTSRSKTSSSTYTSTPATTKDKLLTEQQILKLIQSKARAENEANNIYQKSIQLKQQGKDITQQEEQYMFALVNRSYALTTQLEKQSRINPANYYLAAQKYAEQLRREEEKITRERQKQNRQKAKNYQSQNLAQNTTLAGATQFAQNANTLNRLTTALKYLKEAMSSAKPNTPEWQAANRAYQQTKDKIDAIRKSMGDFKEQQSKVLNISDQLTRKLALVFSVSAIQGYISKLVKVRAEFELQQIALRSILQDKEKADQVFAQVQQLALQSPFSIMELNTYTKQVAAYGFEAEKLVGTTKRLADVSAGLGVDMSRLTLAYGQVKTANYLRATEIRQFTEAGLNITQELANYFTELTGKMVTAGEVTEMVTKRMVRFEDVEEVFKRITSAGGMFYDMQKKQSEGLKGQIQRIGDAYSIMLNEIGKSNQGLISWTLSSIRTLIQSWRDIVPYIKAAAVAAGLFYGAKGIMFLTPMLKNIAAGFALIRAEIVAANGATAMLKAGFAGLGAVMGSMGWTALLMIVGAVVTKFMTASDELGRMRENLDSATTEISNDANNAISRFEELARTVTSATTSYNDKKTAMDELHQIYGEILPQQDLEIENLKKLKGNYDTLTQTIREYYQARLDEKRRAIVEEEFAPKINEAKSDLLADNDVRALLATIRVMIPQATEQEFGSIFEKTSVQAREAGIRSGRDFANMFIENLTKYFNLQGTKLKTNVGIQTIEEMLRGITNRIGGTAAFNDYIEVFNKYNESLDIANGLTAEFATHNDKVVADALKPAQQGYDELKKKLDAFSAAYDALYQKETQNKRKEESGISLSPDDVAMAADAAKQLQEAYKDLGLVPPTLEELKKKIISIGSIQEEVARVTQNTTELFVKNWSKALGGISNNKAVVNFFEEIQNEANKTDLTPIQKNIIELEKNIAKLYNIPLGSFDWLVTDFKTSYSAAAKEIKSKLDELTAKAAQWKSIVSLPVSIAAPNLIAQAEKVTGMSSAQMAQLEKYTQAYTALWKALGGLDSKDKKGRKGSKPQDKTMEQARKRFEFFKRANSEYEKLLKYYGKEEAYLRVLNQMQPEAKELGVDKIFSSATFDKEGTIKSVNAVANMYTKNKKHIKEIRQEEEKIKSPLKIELDFELQQKELDTLSKQIDGIFGGYELYLELDKTGLDKSFMTDLFGIDTFSLDEMAAQVDKWFVDMINEQQKRRTDGNAKMVDNAKDAYELAGEAEKKVYDDTHKKLDDEFRKEMKQRLKEYSKYLTQAYSEAGQIRLKVMQQLADINTLKDADGKDIDEDTKRIMREGVMRDAQKKLDKQKWEDFQSTSMYVQLFDDLDKASTSALENMRTKLEEMRNSLTNLDPSDLKEIMTQYNKIDEAIRARNPFKAFGKSLKEVFTTFKSSKEAQVELEKVNAELEELYEKRRQLEAEHGLMKNDNYVSLKKQQSENDKKIKKELAKGDKADLAYIANLNKENEKIKQQIKLLEKAAGLREGTTVEINTETLVSDTKAVENSISQINKDIKETEEKQGKLRDKAKEWKDALFDASDSFSKANSQIQSIGEALNNFKGAWEDAFGPMSDSMQDFFDDMNYVLGGFNDIDKGLSQIVSGNLISGALNAVTGVFKTIGGLFGVGSHDKKREREIQRQIKLINKLQRAYDQLGEAIQQAYSFDQLTAATKQSQQNLEKQNEALEKAIAAEKAKKHTDWGKVEEWGNQMEDNKRKIIELQQNMINEMGGLATGDAIKSAAEDFVDAWLEAYKETGDGLKGLKEKFDEFFVNLVKKQMLSKIADVYISKWADGLNKAIENDNKVDASEMAQLYRDAEEMLPGMSELMKSIVDMLESSTGIDVMSEKTSELSGLAKGIQGVTEETALVLEALLNSMRYYVSDTNTQVRLLVQLMQNSFSPTTDNLFLSELRLQTAELKAINRLLNSVTKAGHPQGGSGLKVFMN